MIEHRDLIVSMATKFNLDSDLLIAQILVESNNNPYAWNPEPHYRYFWNVKTRTPFRAVHDDEIVSKSAPPDFPMLAGDRDQEWWAQQASWGLMQVMGALARELGFSRPYLTELCDPAQNLEMGCLHLSRLFTWSAGNVDQALSAYNGGRGGNSTPPFRNQAYASKVKARLATMSGYEFRTLGDV